MPVTKSVYRNQGLLFSYKVSNERTVLRPDAHTHTYWELLMLRSGQGIYSVGGKEYSIRKNSLIITRPTDLHSITILPDEPYERYNLAFDPDPLFMQLLESLPPDVDVIDCTGNEILRMLFRKPVYYLEHLDKNMVETLILHTVYEILCNITIISRQPAVSQPVTSNALVSRAVEYVNDNITRPITVNSLSEHLSVSRRHIESLFLTHLNITPKQYIIARKLILARQELRSGSTAAEVCEKYGFSDYSGFYRQYTKFFGHKPSDAAKSENFTDMEF